MPLYDVAPNATEFVEKITELTIKYNGTLPGSEIPAAFIAEGAFYSLLIGMLAMGLTTDPMQVLKYLKRPVGPIIGVFCQFLIMPCITMIAIKVVNFASYEALVIMLYGCAPGGGMSNIIIYWVGGDLDLSITMTMVSCILALAFSPLWLLAVPTLLPVEGEIDIPFADIAINIATVVLPAVFGSFLFWLCQRIGRPKIAEITARVITILVTLLLVLIVALGSYKYQLTAIVTVAQVVFAFFLPFVGFFIAYLLSWMVSVLLQKKWKLDLSHEQFTTIGVETAVQNGRMVNAIVLAIYAENQYALAQTFFFPFLAFGAQVAYGFIGAVIMKIYRRYHPKQNEDVTDEGIKNEAYEDTGVNNNK